ncbi:MAG TPA: TonB-dependent receptor [Terriglobia bacterium]|nr:TonB-dependent receptor [Terriglobia bacterium]
MRWMVLGMLFCVLCSTALWAQDTAQINGTVTDATGAILPGVEVTATQTATGLARSVVTNETGAYALTNLPIGPYRLEAVLPGFRTFSQTGIVLQVSTNPVINISLQIGQVSETIEVQADAALVETRSTGVGQVIDNVRVMELPLSGRQVTELIILSGAAVGGGQVNSNRNYPTDIISVAGGSNNGLTFLLDGGLHNDPYGNQALPLPFPDALQEFKVETSAVPARYGFHAAGAVNVVTKTGTNEFHGSLFEFVRNRMFNARNTFASAKDPLKRNQFGGVVGGPIVKNKLFFFGGIQTTFQRTDAQGTQAYVPTPQMLAGDWTTYASAQCQSGGVVNLRAPFANNRIDPALYSKPSLEVLKRLNTTTLDACGRISFGRRTNQDEYIPIGKVDWQISDKHSLFGRFEMARLTTPSDYDGQSILSISQPDYYRHAKTFVLGDTYSISPTMVSSFRGSVLRTVNDKTLPDIFSFSDIGVKGTVLPDNFPKIALISVSGAFSVLSAPATPSISNSTAYMLADDLSWIRGTHQVGLGVSHVHNMMNYTSATAAPGTMAFTTVNTGLALGDFMIGKANSFTQSRISGEWFRQNFFSLYLQDTWKATSHLTLNYGLRWEPYLAPYDVNAKRAFYSRERFDKGLKSEIFPNAPAGIYFQGEGGIPDTLSMFSNDYKHFAPRVGLAWDPRGDGLMTIRAAYGTFFDSPHLHQTGGRRDTPPNGSSIVVNSPSFEDPWASYPGGVSPYPMPLDRNASFPLNARYAVFPWDTKMPYINQWNLSVQRQVGSNWLLAGNYIGSNIIHSLFRYEANAAVYDPQPSCVIAGRTFAPCSTTGNTNMRRELYNANPQIGQYYANILHGDDGATRTYNAMVLQIQRRRFNGLTIQGNYTWSHCIDDGYNDVLQNTGGQIPSRRGTNRANCEPDRRHNFNLSTVYDTPRLSNRALNVLAGGWSLSGIVRILSGPYLSITSGLDNAFTGTDDQGPIQILSDPYMPNKSMEQWFNPKAFAQPRPGQYGNTPVHSTTGGTFLAPGSIRIDMGVTRKFQIREGQTLEFRAEVFNVPNHVNPGLPNTVLSNSTFGKILAAADPRVMQMALKYVF